jgi:hypothetical protein
MNTILKVDHPRTIPSKLCLIQFSGFRGEDINVKIYDEWWRIGWTPSDGKNLHDLWATIPKININLISVPMIFVLKKRMSTRNIAQKPCCLQMDDNIDNRLIILCDHKVFALVYKLEVLWAKLTQQYPTSSLFGLTYISLN